MNSDGKYDITKQVQKLSASAKPEILFPFNFNGSLRTKYDVDWKLFENRATKTLTHILD